MNDDSTSIKLSDIDNDVYERIKNQLFTYTIGLFKVDEKEKEGTPIGSGTLINFKGTKGILTAKHVSDLIKKESNIKLGLLLHEKIPHKFTIDSNLLNFYQFTNKKITQQNEPDISFITLPSNKVGYISSIKSFYEFFDEGKILENMDNDYHDGIWFVCGFPTWDSSIEYDDVNFKKTFSIIGRCGATGVERNYERDGFDFYEVLVDYSSEDNIPLNFGGMSGGGLWKVTIIHNGIKLEPKQYFLCGLVYYQTEYEKEKKTRVLRCYGRKSLYKKFRYYLDENVR